MGILGFTSLGTRAGSALWDEGFILESSQLWRSPQPSPLVSHLQLQFWPLEGGGPKPQGAGPESCGFVGVLELFKVPAEEGPQEPELVSCLSLQLGKSRPREGNSLMVTERLRGKPGNVSPGQLAPGSGLLQALGDGETGSLVSGSPSPVPPLPPSPCPSRVWGGSSQPCDGGP